MPQRLPERWDAYCPVGTVIPGTKFIAFKVPLKEAFLHSVEEKERFSPSILMNQLEERNLSLAGVIDLTYTWKYYNKEEFLGKSVDHKKVFTKGHEVPSDDVYFQFAQAVESLTDDEKLIGVHCTHGVNRTGYLICRYMIEKLNMNPQEAIDLFNSSRGHNIERDNYINDLKKRKSGEPSAHFHQSMSDDWKPKKERKPRWRHHKEDHPYWRPRRSNYQSASFPSPTNNDGGKFHHPNDYERYFDPSFFPNDPNYFQAYPHDRPYGGPESYRNYRGHIHHHTRQDNRTFNYRQREYNPNYLDSRNYPQRSNKNTHRNHWQQNDFNGANRFLGDNRYQQQRFDSIGHRYT